MNDGSPAAVAPYGAWESPLSADTIVAGAVGLSLLQVEGQDLFWIERRPQEGGRSVVVHRAPDGTRRDVTPEGQNTRTRVHEYGGGDYAVTGQSLDKVALCDFADQRWHEVPLAGGEARVISDPGYRLADAQYDRVRGRLVCVQEDHFDDFEPKNRILSVDIEGGEASVVIAEGNDFYGSPRLSPDGSRLAYLTWSHPDMPWDQCELWVVHFESFSQPGIREHIAGGNGVSATAPRWAPDGSLCYADDRTGFWNLYRYDQGQSAPLCAMEADFATPAWTFGGSSYDFLGTWERAEVALTSSGYSMIPSDESDGGPVEEESSGEPRLLVSWLEAGRWRLGTLGIAPGSAVEPIELPFTGIRNLHAQTLEGRDRALFIGGRPDRLDAVVRIDLASGEVEELASAGSLDLPQGLLSAPEAVEFPTTLDGEATTAHAFYYPPQNPGFEGPEGELPPLIVMSHGGPTSMSEATLRLGTQFWTSRGFAVVDVNYGGSSGFGRAYRERLKGRWGEVDVADCTAAAVYLANAGKVDPKRLTIRGGSAGGYTTLCALTFHETFHAGASHFGVSDLEALARTTHKFESRYLEGLVGPWPAESKRYQARSPIHHADGLSCPVILFQGLEDPVVPPAQAERMVEALRKKEIPVAYVAFEGEQHGFRKAENIRTALEGELYFYGRVFGFEPAGNPEAVLIENLD